MMDDDALHALHALLALLGTGANASSVKLVHNGNDDVSMSKSAVLCHLFVLIGASDQAVNLFEISNSLYLPGWAHFKSMWKAMTSSSHLTFVLVLVLVRGYSKNVRIL